MGSFKDLLDLLNLLKFLDLEELSNVIEKFIINNIKKGGFPLEKLLILSSTAEAYCFKEIISTMIFFLGLKISDVVNLPEVKYMTFEFLENLIKEAKDNFNKEKFFSRFETVRLWIEANNVDDEVKKKLVNMFDLKNFTVQQLITKVRESKLYSESSILDVLSKTVLELQEENGELENDVINELRSKDELSKTACTLKAELKIKEQAITSTNNKVKEANQKAKRAIEELNNAKTKADNLQTEKTKLMTENTSLIERMNRAKKSCMCGSWYASIKTT